MARREYPGVYPYERDGKTAHRTLFRDSAGRPRQKRGFASPTAAAKYRAGVGRMSASYARLDRIDLTDVPEQSDRSFGRLELVLRGHQSPRRDTEFASSLPELGVATEQRLGAETKEN
jgi:hypothetical protein